MADLLKKNNKDKKPLLNGTKETPKPEQVYDRQRLFSVDENVTKKKQKVKKTTTVRCSVEMADALNAIVAVRSYDSIDEVLQYLVRGYLDDLSPDTMREYETVLKLYSRKNKK